MDKPFRCYNADCLDNPHGRLGFDFWAQKPVCPKCETEGEPMVVALILNHLTVKDKSGSVKSGVGNLRIACMPQAKRLPERHTCVAASVNCPACKETDDYKRLFSEPNPVPTESVPDGTKLYG